MDLIIGGAYQGKTEFAKEKYGLSDKDICVCQKDGYIDFNKKGTECVSVPFAFIQNSFWTIFRNIMLVMSFILYHCTKKASRLFKEFHYQIKYF